MNKYNSVSAVQALHASVCIFFDNVQNQKYLSLVRMIIIKSYIHVWAFYVVFFVKIRHFIKFLHIKAQQKIL